jgi:hypothetical protein
MGVSNWKRPFLFPLSFKGFSNTLVQKYFNARPKACHKKKNVVFKDLSTDGKYPILWYSKAYSKDGQHPHSKVFNGLSKDGQTPHSKIFQYPHIIERSIARTPFTQNTRRHPHQSHTHPVSTSLYQKSKRE